MATVHPPIISLGRDTETSGLPTISVGATVITKAGIEAVYPVGTHVWTSKKVGAVYSVIEYRGKVTVAVANNITVKNPAIAEATTPVIWDATSQVTFDCEEDVQLPSEDQGRVTRWSEGGTPKLTKRQVTRNHVGFQFINADISEHTALKDFMDTNGLSLHTLSFYDIGTETQKVHTVLCLDSVFRLSEKMINVCDFGMEFFVKTVDTYT